MRYDRIRYDREFNVSEKAENDAGDEARCSEAAKV